MCVLSGSAHLLSYAAFNPMKTEIYIRGLHHAPSRYVVLLWDEVVRKCSLCTNERFLMTNSSFSTIEQAEIHDFLAFFFSQCSGFSRTKTSEFFTKLDFHVLPLSVVCYLSANILSSAPPNAREVGRVSGVCKRIRPWNFRGLEWQSTICLERFLSLTLCFRYSRWISVGEKGNWKSS